MLLERTITQLDIGPVPPARALELGQFGYLQWLGALPAMADYRKAAIHAHEAAAPFRCRSPAVGIFCDLLMASIRSPVPLDFVPRTRRRRGGARARRAAL